MANVIVSPQQPPDTSLVKAASFALNTNQNGGTFDLATATGGAVLVTLCIAYMITAVTGATSVAIQTNDSTVVQILATTAIANLTLDKSMPPFTTQFVLESGKKIQYTIAGNGTGGTMFLAVSYQPLAAGATLS